MNSGRNFTEMTELHLEGGGLLFLKLDIGHCSRGSLRVNSCV